MIKFTWKPVMGETTMHVGDSFKQSHEVVQLDFILDAISDLKHLYNEIRKSPDYETPAQFWQRQGLK